MGEVYRARDTRLERDVALKLLPPNVTRDPDRVRRFEQEARSASGLNHPAIVAIYELGQETPQPYISMELVDGHDLRELIVSGPLPVRRALHIAAQVADGLAKAHEAARCFFVGRSETFVSFPNPHAALDAGRSRHEIVLPEAARRVLREGRHVDIRVCFVIQSDTYRPTVDSLSPKKGNFPLP